MKSILYYIVFSFWFLASLLPLRLLYVFSDLLYYPLYYGVRYRRKVVRNNLVSSFPEKDMKEIIQIEKDFYSFFCDYMVETVKLFSMSKKEMQKRMTFEGTELVTDAFDAGRSCSCYLGHYCNWEWVSSLPIHLGRPEICGQVYHPLESKAFDKLFLYLRGRFGAQSITMDDTFRTVIGWKKSKILNIVGYISDQVPGYESVHYFADFLHHDTPVFTGTERISKIADTTVVYLDISRPKRGYYLCRFVKIADSLNNHPIFYATEQYFRLLEQTIQRAPQYWLWSHNRWKRTREEFNQLFSEEERTKRLSRP
ncbi:MAG: lysophospholipid acyltransferase family protein [Bacteroides sp.]|uniref:lysophospholipid acyltransferase family protein n=1 Tax=Bacteroides sp. TaxID=29523 RepID=UPI001B47E680|nr:lysophospholipid acyltransferase family protein [Bacteroides sp.]MBP6066690.1 lysophospholipid acyltransferase family protein [Bacteroides sp.]MBP9508229.1 lysophospholipid acyltransferase family protein [Bacteroides sp.]